MMIQQTQLPAILRKYESDLLQDWSSAQTAILGRRLNVADEKVAATISREFLNLLQTATQSGNFNRTDAPEWAAVREFLADLSSSRAKAGYTPVETANFVLSLKEPLFALLRRDVKEATDLIEELRKVTLILDKLALITMDSYQRTREEVIARQQEELIELSTPVVRLWDNILALPLIGTLDSSRTQVVMQNLLEAIVSTRSDIAIIDITGVPTVDTLVAQHLLKTVAAARLMGADCIISGIRPQIAQTIIHLGVDLSAVTTKATMADALRLALERAGLHVVKAAAGPR
jgi:rsbT co-antagonist protein RsbR